MKVAEYLVEALQKKNVTDVFGIPGGVVIDFLYALDNSSITPHLSYHEQAAALEACGYAQVNYSLAVAYATRGPGFTNLITGIAEAYAESLPVLFITGHSGRVVGHDQRFEKEQEMNTVQMVKHITKYAASIDSLEEVVKKIDEAIKIALSNRKGPVFLDFSASLWNKEIIINHARNTVIEPNNTIDTTFIARLLEKSKRPLLLLGDGIKQAGIDEELVKELGEAVLPVLTSRGAQDLKDFFGNYYGYVGSHGIRYANTIFAKADLVLALGNRLAFPLESESFKKGLQNKAIIRFEIDESELKREPLNCTSIQCDVKQAVSILLPVLKAFDCTDWLQACDSIKHELQGVDLNPSVMFLKRMFDKSDYSYIVPDVGNNEFWASQAYESSMCNSRVLYSKSFGVLGCAICKAIGVHYQSGESVLVVTGDQGMQLNIQELQVISKEKLPIQIVIINNSASGMIKDREEKKGYYIHTTLDSGYSNPDFESIAKAYGIDYSKVSGLGDVKESDTSSPMIIEYLADADRLEPGILLGDAMDDMYPKIEESLLLKIRNM